MRYPHVWTPPHARPRSSTTSTVPRSVSLTDRSDRLGKQGAFECFHGATWWRWYFMIYVLSLIIYIYMIWYDMTWFMTYKRCDIWNMINMIYDYWYMIIDIWYVICDICYDMLCSDLIWYDMIRCEWYDMPWYDMIWYDIMMVMMMMMIHLFLMGMIWYVIWRWLLCVLERCRVSIGLAIAILSVSEVWMGNSSTFFSRRCQTLDLYG